MELSRKKTWSREVLAVQQHLEGGKDSGFLTYEKRAMLLLAVKTALAAGLCYWLATLAHLQDGYWGSISAIIVLQSNVGSTVTASRDRLLGTLIGAGFGAVFSLADGGRWVIGIYLLAVVLAMVTCSLLGLKNSARLAGVTVTIILLVHRTGSNWSLPFHRVMEVILGIVVALGFSVLVLPSRARARVKDGLAQEFLLLGALFDVVMDEVRGKEAEGRLKHVWKDVDGALEANGGLLAAARNEPGSGTLEGLSLLHQFGRGLRDILHALELAGKSGDAGGSPTEYLGQLEPELGRLVEDIHKGFQYVAGCIHRWEFGVAPGGLMLEEDIAALEGKMAAIRPTGLEFPQGEILRAYAVQLHLKQLARLLRASRVETSAAVG